MDQLSTEASYDPGLFSDVETPTPAPEWLPEPEVACMSTADEAAFIASCEATGMGDCAQQLEAAHAAELRATCERAMSPEECDRLELAYGGMRSNQPGLRPGAGPGPSIGPDRGGRRMEMSELRPRDIVGELLDGGFEVIQLGRWARST